MVICLKKKLTLYHIASCKLTIVFTTKKVPALTSVVEQGL